MGRTLWQFLNRRVQWPNRFIKWLKSIDSLMLAVATVALDWIAFWQWAALDHTDKTLKDTLVAANRAWIKVSGMNTLGDIRDQNDFKADIYYDNVGKGPATSANASFNGGTAPFPDGFDFSMPVSVGPNHTCDGLLPDRNGLAIFPDIGEKQFLNTTIPRKIILPSVILNKGALYVQGCFAYETMNEMHKTWFCFIAFMNGQSSTLSKTVQCKDGQGAS